MSLSTDEYWMSYLASVQHQFPQTDVQTHSFLSCSCVENTTVGVGILVQWFQLSSPPAEIQFYEVLYYYKIAKYTHNHNKFLCWGQEASDSHDKCYDMQQNVLNTVSICIHTRIAHCAYWMMTYLYCQCIKVKVRVLQSFFWGYNYFFTTREGISRFKSSYQAAVQMLLGKLFCGRHQAAF